MFFGGVSFDAGGLAPRRWFNHGTRIAEGKAEEQLAGGGLQLRRLPAPERSSEPGNRWNLSRGPELWKRKRTRHFIQTEIEPVPA